MSECPICYETRDEFVTLCNTARHNICQQCFNGIVDITICPICRQQNPIYQRLQQQQLELQTQTNEDSFRSVVDWNTGLNLQIGQQGHVRITFQREDLQFIRETIINLIDSLQIRRRRSARIQQRQSLQNLGRNYRM